MLTKKFFNNHLIRNPGVAVVLGYIFFSVIPHAIAPRYILASLMLLVALYQLYKRQLERISLDMVTVTLLALVAIVVGTAVASPYRAESLPIIHKETLPFLLAYLLLTCQKFDVESRKRIARYAIAALIAGFFVKMSLAIWAGVKNDWSISLYEGATQLPRYIDFFAADIIYYLPFLLGPLLFWPMKSWCRWFLGLVVLLTLIFAFVSGVRTTFIFVCITVAFFVICRYWAQKWYFFALMVLCSVTVYFSRNYVTDPSIARYYSVFSINTYKGDNDPSLMARKSIARGVWEIAQDRIWLGYGLGWKKLPTVAIEGGYVDRWKNSEDAGERLFANYCTWGEGRVNPHNFYLAVLFEIGVLGLVAYLALMLELGFTCLLGSLNRKTSSDARGIYIAVMLYICVYLGAGLSGGPWLPVTLLVTAASVVLYREKSKLSF